MCVGRQAGHPAGATRRHAGPTGVQELSDGTTRELSVAGCSPASGIHEGVDRSALLTASAVVAARLVRCSVERSDRSRAGDGASAAVARHVACLQGGSALSLQPARATADRLWAAAQQVRLRDCLVLGRLVGGSRAHRAPASTFPRGCSRAAVPRLEATTRSAPCAGGSGPRAAAWPFCPTPPSFLGWFITGTVTARVRTLVWPGRRGLGAVQRRARGGRRRSREDAPARAGAVHLGLQRSRVGRGARERDARGRARQAWISR